MKEIDETLNDNFEQKCLCVFVIDTYGLKNDIVMDEVSSGIRRILDDLESDETSRNRIEVSFISYDCLLDDIRIIQDPVPISHAIIPPLISTNDYASIIKAVYMAMDVVEKRKEWYKITGIPYYRPWIFLISNGLGLLSCNFDEIAGRIRQDAHNKRYAFLSIYTKDAEVSLLQEIGMDTPIMSLDSFNIKDCFQWFSSSMSEIGLFDSEILIDHDSWMDAKIICDSNGGKNSSKSSGSVDDARGNFVVGDSYGGVTNSESSGYDRCNHFDGDGYIDDFGDVSHSDGANCSQDDEEDWPCWPDNDMSLESFESKPHRHSVEEKAQQIAEEKIAVSQLEQLRHEEDRCRKHIDRIRNGLKEQKHIETYCMIRRDDLPSTAFSISDSRRFDTIDKMQDLLNRRLAQLQNSTSFFERLRGENELKMINELLMLLESIEKERLEMMRYVERSFQEKVHEVEHRLSYSGIRVNKESVYCLESCLSDYERELHDLMDRKRRIENELDRKKKDAELDEVFSSVFASAEVKQKSHMLVQVYLHLFEETEEVKKLARESQKGTKRRDYRPLDCKLRKGDKVDVLLNIYGETLMMSDKKSVVWQGTFSKCSFDYFVPKDIDVDELSCVASLSVNGVPVGEMRFITKIVENPRQLNPEIIAHKYNKVFISYSHQDESKVKFLHEGLELGSVPHFFDRKYLKAGDVFPQVIQDYINSADLFILCWSENASKSEYVDKERRQALERAFPQVKPEQDAKLRIYPMSIEPRAELPSDMKENYHFGEI